MVIETCGRFFFIPVVKSKELAHTYVRSFTVNKMVRSYVRWLVYLCLFLCAPYVSILVLRRFMYLAVCCTMYMYACIIQVWIANLSVAVINVFILAIHHFHLLPTTRCAWSMGTQFELANPCFTRDTNARSFNECITRSTSIQALTYISNCSLPMTKLYLFCYFFVQKER